MTANLRFLPVLLASLLAVPSFASTTPTYNVTPIVKGSAGEALRMNNWGQAVGSAIFPGNTDVDAAVWANGSTTRLNLREVYQARYTNGVAINDSGTVLAEVGDLNNGLVTITNGVVSSVPVLPNHTAVSGADINNRGQVTGAAWVPTGNAQYPTGWHAFIYTPNGGTADLGTLNGDLWSWGTAVNNAGVVIGNSQDAADNRRPFIYSDGIMREMATLGGNYTEYTALNDSGVAAGFAYRPDGMQVAVMYVDGEVIEIGHPRGDGSAAFGINSAGKVVGTTYEFGWVSPFLYSGGVMHNLRDMVDPAWDISQAFAINDRDQIIAVGYDPDGVYQYVMLTPAGAAIPSGPNISPVPEPAQYIVLMMGLGLLGLVINRQRPMRSSIQASPAPDRQTAQAWLAKSA